jgi:hypothetical protein
MADASDGMRRRLWNQRFLLLCCFLSFWVLRCIPFGKFAQAQEQQRLVRVIVALADNEHQGIVPVPKALGNGDDPKRNLYWGAAFGVRTFLRNSNDWREIGVVANPASRILERSTFQHKASGTLLIADAYRGEEIKAAIEEFFRESAGQEAITLTNRARNNDDSRRRQPATLLVYVGHDGLMDFSLEKSFPAVGSESREAIVLACASRAYFSPGLRPTGAKPLLWTTGLMAPEAYTLKAALDGWIAGESGDEIRQRAAGAYAKYQKISVNAARRLFVSGL